MVDYISPLYQCPDWRPGRPISPPTDFVEGAGPIRCTVLPRDLRITESGMPLEESLRQSKLRRDADFEFLSNPILRRYMVELRAEDSSD